MTEGWTHTPNWYCLYVGCPKCSFRRGYMCFYDELTGDYE
jgi:hypothetical protein